MSDIAKNMLISVASAVMGIIGLHLLNTLLEKEQEKIEITQNIYLLKLLYHNEKTILYYSYYLVKAVIIILVVNIVIGLFTSFVIVSINQTSLNTSILGFNYYLTLDSLGRALLGFVLWGIIGTYIFTIGRKKDAINFYIFINCGFIGAAFVLPLSTLSYIFERYYELYTPNDLYNLVGGALIRLWAPIPLYSFGYGFLLGMMFGFAKKRVQIELLYKYRYKIYTTLLIIILSLFILLGAHHNLHFTLISLRYENILVVWGAYFILFFFFLLLGSTYFDCVKKNKRYFIDVSEKKEGQKTPRILSFFIYNKFLTKRLKDKPKIKC